MAGKDICFQAELQSALLRGINRMADTVRVTLGPRGRYVALERKWGSPMVTKDGVTVAKEIEFEDRLENLAAKMLKEVATKTHDTAGDGTTTATVLAQAIYREGVKNVVAGANPMALKRGIERGLKPVIEHLENQSKKIRSKEDLVNVASVAANNDRQIGEMIAEAMERVGKDGAVTVEDGKGTATSLEVVEGMQFDRGYLSPYFVTDGERMECVLEDPLILLYEKKISSTHDLLPLLESLQQKGRAFLIISEEVEGDALATLVVNRLRGTLKVCAVKAPAFGDRRKAILEDIAVLTGSRLITEDLGIKLENVQPSDLGRAKRVVIRKEDTTIVQGAGKKSEIEGRIATIRSELEKTTSDYDREKLQERLAKLSGGVAILKVGAPTESAMKEVKARIEDSLSACKAASAEGVVAGGGLALLRAQEQLDKLKVEDPDEQTGIKILRRALEEPMRMIAHNAGNDASVVVNKVREAGKKVGYNAITGDLEDMMAAGIIDPTKVVRTAIENATSIAGLLITTEASVTEAPERKKGGAGGAEEEDDLD